MKNLPGPYTKGVVKGVSRYPDGNLLIKTGSKYCLNLGRNHNSCGIYFFGSPYGIFQKCLCPCNTLEGRKNGYCKDFTSEIFKWTDELKLVLFPNYDYSGKKKKKERNVFKPMNPKREFSDQKAFCDNLFNEIMKS